MARIQVSKDLSGRIVVSFPYDPLIVEQVKSINGRRWHPADKYWSFPELNGNLERILRVLGNGSVEIYSVLKGTAPILRTIHPYPPHRWGGSPTLHSFGDGAEREGVKKLESGLSPKYSFEDLRGELVSRKFSYKTVKGYIYYNLEGGDIDKI